MFPVIQVFTTFCVLLCVWHFLKVLWARSRFPPGPVPLPVVGNMGTLGFQIHPERLLKVAGVYGNTYTIWVGQTPMIVLNGFQAVKDALIDHSAEFIERPISPFFRDLVGGPHGVIFANGHTWKQQRRFSLMTLRNLGLGKKSLESSIQGQARWLVETFAREKGRPMDPSVPILSSITNVIAAVLFGHCFPTEDNTFQQLIRGCQAMAEFQGTVWPHLYNAFPSLMKHLSPVLIKSLAALTHFHELHGLIKEEIKCHQENWLPEEPRDFTDLYLSQMVKTQEDPASTFKEHNMIQVITDLFIAGSDTTTITLYWALLYMMAYPDVQARVQEELDTVLGPSRMVQYEDRKSLPYTNAVIHESQRYSSISAIGVMRKCVKDTTVQGFSVMKGTLIFPNILSVLYDPDEWETPRRFNPRHFLDQDGNFVNREAFLPFSAGHRVCLGEQLARMDLFIIFSSLLQTFTFQLPEGVKEINQEQILGGILQPHPYKTCAIRR